MTPAGGFPLRGCLVSSLEDNGVPAGDLRPRDPATPRPRPHPACGLTDLPPTGVKGNVQGNLFKIITGSDTHYFLQAPSRQDKTGWIEAIREHA